MIICPNSCEKCKGVYNPECKDCKKNFDWLLTKSREN